MTIKMKFFLFLIFLFAVSNSYAQKQFEIKPVDQINTINNEIAPCWYLTDLTSAVFFFERSESWYLDDFGHQLMQTSVLNIPDSGFWLKFSPPSLFDVKGITPGKYEIGPLWTNQNTYSKFFVGISDINLAKTSSPNKSNIGAVNSKGEYINNYGPFLRLNSSDSWQSHPSATLGNEIIFFSSDRPGGKGKTDIWYIVKTSEDTYSDPINAEELNSEYDEIFPSVDPQNARVIVFSSSRPRDNKNCGFDIYQAERFFKDGENFKLPIKFSSPTLVPYVNSDYNDISFVGHDGSTAFFASDRPRPKWDNSINFDIYQVSPNPVDIPIPDIGDGPSGTPTLCDSMPITFTLHCKIIDPVDGSEVTKLDIEPDKKNIFVFYPKYAINDVHTYLLVPNPMADYITMPSFIHRYSGNNWVCDRINLSPRSTPCPIVFQSATLFDAAKPTPTTESIKPFNLQIDSLNASLDYYPPGTILSIRVDGYTEGKATTYKKNTGKDRASFLADFDLSKDRAEWVQKFCYEAIQDYVSQKKLSIKVKKDSTVGHGYLDMDTPFIDSSIYSAIIDQVPEEARKWISSLPKKDADSIHERNRRVKVSIKIELPK